MTIGQKLQKERDRRGINQTVVAEEIGVLGKTTFATSQISRWENDIGPDGLYAQLVERWIADSKEKHP